MLTRKIHSRATTIDFTAIRAELGIPDSYPPVAVTEAAAATPPAPGRDATGIPFVTIDPAGSTDLDQAMHLQRCDGGYRVHYAIADVASFVAPGGALDSETRRRGLTLYSPDIRTPLHPTVMSEGSASLLPGQDRPAVLWTITLDEQGEPVTVGLERALVRSVAKLDYAGVQADSGAGTLHPSIELLAQIGKLRQQAARRRHAINLDLPDAEVVQTSRGRWTLTRRSVSEVEKYNAEISLLTGMCAAGIMLRGKVGLLRTLPPPDQRQIAALRRATAVLGIAWPPAVPPGDVISALDSAEPMQAAFLEDAVRLLRGAGYTAFDGRLPEQTGHGGVGAPYAHVTAPLRRLADRFATEVCLALHTGTAIPDWARASLPELDGIMAAADRVSDELDRACEQAVSIFLLAGRDGERFSGVVVQVDRDRATVLLDDPPVRAHCPADGLTDGTRVTVTLTSVDPQTHAIAVVPLRT